MYIKILLMNLCKSEEEKDMKQNNQHIQFIKGIKAGLPVGLGYLSVSFSFGVICMTYGFPWWQALFISITNLTSAGQFAGIGIMAAAGSFLEMLIVQFTINLRYSFMSLSLSQKVDDKFKGIYRWLFSFFVTDEIFAVAMLEKEISRFFFAGLASVPFIGWSLGTLLGSVFGSIMPKSIVSALGIALYAMFIAIVVPGMKEHKSIIAVVLIAIILRVGFYYLPFLSKLSSGFAMIICAVLAALFGAFLYPVQSSRKEECHAD